MGRNEARETDLYLPFKGIIRSATAGFRDVDQKGEGSS